MSSLAQLILVGLLATCATAVFIEESDVYPGYVGQPKWTWKIKLNYLELVGFAGEVRTPPFTFIVNGEPMNAEIGFKHSPTSDLQTSLIINHKDRKQYSFKMNGTMTLHNQRGFSDIVRLYDWFFSSRNMFPIDYRHPYRNFANKSVILNAANGWIENGSILTTITFNY